MKKKKHNSYSFSALNGIEEAGFETGVTGAWSALDDENNGGPAEQTMNGESADACSEPKRRGRRTLSDFDLQSHSRIDRIRRRPSHIDGLSAEVLKALQATFGGKLDEIRSRNSSPAVPQTTSRKPPQAPIPSSNPPSPSPSPSPPTAPAAPRSLPRPAVKPPLPKRTFLERLSDREGAYILLAYFSTVALAWLLITMVDHKDDDRASKTSRMFHDNDDVGCVVVGSADELYNGRCARLLGYILPAGLLAIWFLLALALFMVDVSFNLFEILTSIESYIAGKRKISASFRSEKPKNGKEADSSAAAGGSTSQELLFLCAINFCFVVPPSALLWISRIATVDPLGTVCGRRLQLFWMLGLAILCGIILWEAVHSFTDPPQSKSYSRLAAKFAMIVLCALILSTALFFRNPQHHPGLCEPCTRLDSGAVNDSLNYTHGLVEAKKVQPSCEIIEQFCGNRRRDVCSDCRCEKCWRRPRMHPNSESVHNMRAQEGCGTSFIEKREWPEAKWMQISGQRDHCLLDFPQCEWAAAKQVQLYAPQGCRPRDLRCDSNVSRCEWLGLKQIQVYEGKGCSPLSDQCGWPWMKQVQLFGLRSELDGYDEYPEICDWSWMKQVQFYRASERDGYHAYPEVCEWSWRTQVQPFRDPELEGIDKYPEKCGWPWITQVQPVKTSEKLECGANLST